MGCAHVSHVSQCRPGILLMSAKACHLFQGPSERAGLAVTDRERRVQILQPVIAGCKMTAEPMDVPLQLQRALMWMANAAKLLGPGAQIQHQKLSPLGNVELWGMNCPQIMC